MSKSFSNHLFRSPFSQLLLSLASAAQNTGKAAVPGSVQPINVRVDDLIKRMTLEEKASQLVNQARAIPDFKSRNTTGGVRPCTELPTQEPPRFFLSPSDWPRPLMLPDSRDGGRDRHRSQSQAQPGRARRKAGHLWKASISGRPTSTSSAIRAGAAARKPMAKIPFSPGAWAWPSSLDCRATIPNTYRVISTPKHYAVHSGPEPSRHTIDMQVSKHDMEDTYLPAFRATVTEGKAGSVMCAYNRVNGQPACANTVPAGGLSCAEHGNSRAMWFPIAMPSPTSSSGHHFTKSQAEAAAIR